MSPLAPAIGTKADLSLPAQGNKSRRPAASIGTAPRGNSAARI